MGSGCSSQNSQVATVDDVAQAEQPKSVWKIFPSISEAKGFYKADGTFDKFIDPGHLELRTLMDEPTGQHALGVFAKSIMAPESFMCWVDLQEFKIIPEDAHAYRYSKAKHIYHKYIKAGTALEFGRMEPKARENYRHLLEESKNDSTKITPQFYKDLHSLCFIDIYQNVFKQFKQTDKYKKLIKEFKMKYNSVRVDDFWYYRKLGQGGFGIVVHCQKKSTGVHYAMKIQNKLGLLNSFSDDMNRVDFEKQAFASCRHPFIVNLDYAFQTETLAIMCLGLAKAGDLHQAMKLTALNRLPEDRVKFYAAEIVLALQHLHSLGIMYRDLKPNNILLDADGHVRLADLGGVIDQEGQTLGRKSEFLHPLFSIKYNEVLDESDETSFARGKKKLKRRMSVMGTFGYMAPEMVVLLSQSSSQRKGYSEAVDWWSLGVTLYKLLTGSKPFEKPPPVVDPDDDSLFPPPKKETEEYKILFQEVNYPSYVSENSKEFLKALLNTKEEERLGYGPNGAEDIKKHKFFDGIMWDKLRLKHQIPPFLPDHTEMDDSQKHASFADMLASIGKEHWQEKYVNAKFQHFFDTWDYISPDTLRIEFGIANEMDRLDKKFKVHQDGEHEGTHEGLSSYKTSLHFLNSIAPPADENKYEQKLFFDEKDNVDVDEEDKVSTRETLEQMFNDDEKDVGAEEKELVLPVNEDEILRQNAETIREN